MIIANKIASKENFYYHWRCDRVGITHLCFADDLLLFGSENISSAILLKQALDTFFSLSGLEANEAKSLIFVASSDPLFKESMLELFGYQLGTLPVRYLGVPLIYQAYLSRLQDSS